MGSYEDEQAVRMYDYYYVLECACSAEEKRGNCVYGV